jgi:hypothetical protein
MSKHRRAPGHKPPGDRKQKQNGKNEVKEKTVAAELGSAVMREEAPKPAPPPVARPERPAPAKEAVKQQAPEPPPAAKAKAPEPPRPAVKEKVPEPPPPAAKQKAPEPPPPAAKQKTPERPPLAAKEKPQEAPRHLLETAVDTFERSFKAAGQGTIEVNRKLLDFTRANLSSGFDFAMSLASASSPVHLMQLQMSYWDERMKVLASQAEELRVLSADLVAKTSEPIREHMRRAHLA